MQAIKVTENQIKAEKSEKIKVEAEKIPTQAEKPEKINIEAIKVSPCQARENQDQNQNVVLESVFDQPNQTKLNG